jgi:lipopolysaccharide export system protein LptA
MLTGNVKITRGQNQLRGDKVESDFASGRSRLINTGHGRVSALIVGTKDQPLATQVGQQRNQGEPNAAPPASPFIPVRP